MGGIRGDGRGTEILLKLGDMRPSVRSGGKATEKHFGVHGRIGEVETKARVGVETDRGLDHGALLSGAGENGGMGGTNIGGGLWVGGFDGGFWAEELFVGIGHGWEDGNKAKVSRNWRGCMFFFSFGRLGGGKMW